MEGTGPLSSTNNQQSLDYGATEYSIGPNQTLSQTMRSQTGLTISKSNNNSNVTSDVESTISMHDLNTEKQQEANRLIAQARNILIQQLTKKHLLPDPNTTCGKLFYKTLLPIAAIGSGASGLAGLDQHLFYIFYIKPISQTILPDWVLYPALPILFFSIASINYSGLSGIKDASTYSKMGWTIKYRENDFQNALQKINNDLENKDLDPLTAEECTQLKQAITIDPCRMWLTLLFTTFVTIGQTGIYYGGLTEALDAWHAPLWFRVPFIAFGMTFAMTASFNLDLNTLLNMWQTTFKQTLELLAHNGWSKSAQYTWFAVSQLIYVWFGPLGALLGRASYLEMLIEMLIGHSSSEQALITGLVLNLPILILLQGAIQSTMNHWLHGQSKYDAYKVGFDLTTQQGTAAFNQLDDTNQAILRSQWPNHHPSNRGASCAKLAWILGFGSIAFLYWMTSTKVINESSANYSLAWSGEDEDSSTINEMMGDQALPLWIYLSGPLMALAFPILLYNSLQSAKSKFQQWAFEQRLPSCCRSRSNRSNRLPSDQNSQLTELL